MDGQQHTEGVALTLFTARPGKPEEVLPRALKAWSAKRMCFEWCVAARVQGAKRTPDGSLHTPRTRDWEPYAQARDDAARQAAQAVNCEVVTPVGHTMYDPRAVIAANKGSPPLTYTAFLKVIDKMGGPLQPVADAPAVLPSPLPNAEALSGFSHGIPEAEALGYPPMDSDAAVAFVGGETQALRMLEAHLARTQWVAAFDKPQTDPTQRILPLSRTAVPSNPFEAAKGAKQSDGAGPSSGAPLLVPSTTGLSPYLKFGCLSSRLFARRLRELEKSLKMHTQPPTSLMGQLLWREFYYAVATGTPNYERMVGNKVSRQIPWARDEALIAAWENARTGFPWIDAAMTQLRTQGWMHHLARHCVACFLTRGDLYQSWEEGVRVFDRLLLDADPALNIGNWLWLSASAFFYQYFRVYSPVAFPKKYDPKGAYVRHFLPVLAKMPDKYIYEPWKAPLDVQRAAGCIIGKDYPAPIVDHETASKANMDKHAKAYAAHKAAHGGGGDDDDEKPSKKAKK